MNDVFLKDGEKIANLMAYEGLKIVESEKAFRMSIEAVLLANFVSLNPRIARIMDFGTGTGAIPLMLSQWTKAKITGVEIQSELCELAVRSVKLNGLAQQIEIDMDDIAAVHLHYRPSSFDIVVSNPPFFTGEGNKGNNDKILVAKHETQLSFSTLAKQASRMLKEGGKFDFIHRADRLQEIILVLQTEKFAIKRIRLVYSKPGTPALWILIEAANKGNRGSLSFAEPLYVYDQNGNYTPEVSGYFHRPREV